MVPPSSGHVKSALLLTGPPGVGKTTVIRRVADGLAGRRLGGFVTEEIRVGAQRVGFGIETFDGQSAVFAHVDKRSPHRVGRYGVDVAALDTMVDSALAPDIADVYLVDEIGKMECLSKRFVAAVTALLDSGRLLVATIAARGGGFMKVAKTRSDLEVWTVTQANRDELPAGVLAWLAGRLR